MAGLTAVFVVVMSNVMAVYFYRWRQLKATVPELATLAMGAAEAPNPPHPTKSNPDPTHHIQ